MVNQSLPVQSEACCTPLVREPLTKDWAGDLARMFKALGDPVRLRLLSLVASHAGGEACVCEISPAFDLSQPTISHHLKVLRAAGPPQCLRPVPGAASRAGGPTYRRPKERWWGRDANARTGSCATAG